MKLFKDEVEKYLDANYKWFCKSLDLMELENPEEAERLKGLVRAVLANSPVGEEHVMKVTELTIAALERTLTKMVEGRLANDDES